MQFKWKFSLALLFSVFLLGSVSFFFFSENEVLTDIRFYFNDEKSYHDYIVNKVRFKNISFEEINIEKGDNFWKVAKRHNVKIDSLIGVNPHWKSLFARVNQKVIVPSENGILEFIDDFDDVEKLKKNYGVDDSSIVVEEKPSFYEYYYKYKDDRKPIAVFIKSVKPRTESMTDGLAKSFKQREMFRSPLGGRLSSFFGNRKHPIYKKRKFHNGLDIAARRGTYIGAARAGRVIFTGWNGGYGKAVIIQHDRGYKTLYGHMSSILIKKGQTVKAGRILGRVGSTGLSTGPHLHFTVWKDGKLINPLNLLW